MLTGDTVMGQLAVQIGGSARVLSRPSPSLSVMSPFGVAGPASGLEAVVGEVS
jgi:hypothetical protein